MVYSIQTLVPIKLQEFIGHIKQHFMTHRSPMAFKISLNAVSKLGSPPDLQPDSMLFGRLERTVVIVTVAVIVIIKLTIKIVTIVIKK